jgi:hypothetical protein
MSQSRAIAVVQLARLTVAFVGAALALVVIENTAQAGCGDYVFVRNAQGQLVRASSLMSHAGCSGPNCHRTESTSEADSADQSIPAEENIPPKLPCHGPNCSGRSELPASPTPLPVPVRSVQESTALLVNLSDNDSEDGARFAAVPAASAHELHYPQSIFHPPR